MEGDNEAAAAAAAYLEQHSLPALFETLMGLVLDEKPGDPLPFLAQTLCRMGGLSLPQADAVAAEPSAKELIANEANHRGSMPLPPPDAAGGLQTRGAADAGPSDPGHGVAAASKSGRRHHEGGRRRRPRATAAVAPHAEEEERFDFEDASDGEQGGAGSAAGAQLAPAAPVVLAESPKREDSEPGGQDVRALLDEGALEEEEGGSAAGDPRDERFRGTCPDPRYLRDWAAEAAEQRRTTGTSTAWDEPAGVPRAEAATRARPVASRGGNAARGQEDEAEAGSTSDADTVVGMLLSSQPLRFAAEGSGPEEESEEEDAYWRGGDTQPLPPTAAGAAAAQWGSASVYSESVYSGGDGESVLGD